MNVLLNASNLTKGGGIQVAASIVLESQANSRGIVWHYALSREVADEVAGLGVHPKNVEVFDVSPSRSRAQRKRLEALEQDFDVGAVFTVFGPAYANFKAPHLLGVAACWVTHSTWLAYSTLPGWTKKIHALLTSVYKGWWFRRAQRWVVEAENARSGMARRMAIDPEQVDIVPNTCATLFAQADVPAARRPEQSEPVRLIYVSAYYPHKNMEFVPRVAAALKSLRPEQKFEFTLTLPAQDSGQVMQEVQRLGVSDSINNVGRVPLSQLIDLYRESDICFMPSVLETFSATYVEAMAVGRPIVASDLDFAHAVCRDAAVYFDPRDPVAAASQILALLDSESRWQECISRGKARLASLPTATQRYAMYVDSIKATISGGTNIAAEIEREI